MALDPLKQLARQVLARADDDGALHDERQHEITEAVGVAEGNRGEIDVARADAHGLDDVAAIGEQVLRAAFDGLGQGAGAEVILMQHVRRLRFTAATLAAAPNEWSFPSR